MLILVLTWSNENDTTRDELDAWSCSSETIPVIDGADVVMSEA